MKVAILGVSHWHLPLYLDPLLACEGVEIVAVSDPQAATAEAVGRRLGCLWSAHWDEVVDRTAPDLAIVLGRHIDMPAVCQGLIDRGIPFAVEKPAGVASWQVRALAEEAQQRGAFAAVPFVFRHSAMLDTFLQVGGEGSAVYFAAKFSAGSVDRYRGGSEWMLDRTLSGGGCMLNLGIHFFDLARILFGDTLRVDGATMSNALDGYGVEDHGVVTLRGAHGTALIETGYIYPSPHLTFDMHLSIRTRTHHIAARDDSGFEVRSTDGGYRWVDAPTANPPYYPIFVRDLVERVREGAPPRADLHDLAASFALIEDAYRRSPLPASGD